MLRSEFNFNSIKVQLKPAALLRLHQEKGYFNSIKVQLKPVNP